MKVSIAPVPFRPVTIVLDSQDELDQLLAVISQVAENRINHIPQIMRAAITLRDSLLDVVNRG